MNRIAPELREQPYVWAVSDEKRHTYCSFCALAKPSMKRCSRCQFLYYCSTECQTLDWPDHKLECRRLRARQNAPVVDGVRVVFRAIQKLGRPEDQPKKGRTFADLISHAKDMQQSPAGKERFQVWEKAFLSFWTVQTASEDACCPEGQDLLELYGKIMSNAFGLTDWDLQPFGIGLYLNLCRIDHSCDANGRLIFAGRVAHIIPLSSQSLSLFVRSPVLYSRITHSYIFSLDTLSTRREKLEADYYFHCECDACKNHVRNEHMEAFCCDNPRCRGDRSYGVGTPPGPIRCRKCGNLFEDTDTVQIVLGATKAALESFDKPGARECFPKMLEVSSKVLSMQGGILYKYNLLRLKTARLAFLAATKLQRWEEAVNHGKVVLEIYKYYLAPWDPLLAIMLRNLGNACLRTNLIDQAKEYLLESRHIWQNTFGEDSEACKVTEELLTNCSYTVQK